ncbi:MAG TPA: hypothetical protein VFQ42_21955 [Mycobacterium sp.]|nr:hypothetical protein [Mycobacterium sp.]
MPLAIIRRRPPRSTEVLPSNWSPRQQLVAQGTLAPPALSPAMRAESRTATVQLPAIGRTSSRDIPCFGGDEGAAS